MSEGRIKKVVYAYTSINFDRFDDSAAIFKCRDGDGAAGC
jgi:hypothetical protein